MVDPPHTVCVWLCLIGDSQGFLIFNKTSSALWSNFHSYHFAYNYINNLYDIELGRKSPDQSLIRNITQWGTSRKVDLLLVDRCIACTKIKPLMCKVVEPPHLENKCLYVQNLAMTQAAYAIFRCDNTLVRIHKEQLLPYTNHSYEACISCSLYTDAMSKNIVVLKPSCDWLQPARTDVPYTVLQGISSSSYTRPT